MADKLELNWPGKGEGYAIVRDEKTGEPRQVPHAGYQARLLIEVERYYSIYDTNEHSEPYYPTYEHELTSSHHGNGNGKSYHGTGYNGNGNGNGNGKNGYNSHAGIQSRTVNYVASNGNVNMNGASSHRLGPNILIRGDNLHALQALRSEDYEGKVHLIYADPPFNTGSAFAHYHDGLEHSLWLTMMRDRLQLMKTLLHRSGSIWVQLDDNEAHYCRVLMDEIFGRRNFVADITWQKVFSPKSTSKHISAMHDHILVYANNANLWKPNLLQRTERQDKRYKNPDNDRRGPWMSGDLSARNYYSLGTYPVTTPSGRVIPGPPKGTYWRVAREKLAELDADKRIWWGRNGNNVPRLKRFLSEVRDGVTPQTIWFHEDVGNTQEAKKEILALFPDQEDVFATAKPERLIKRIIEMSTNPGDLVLDPFLGSGTTAAVAHKMGRRWIGIEAGEHAETLARVRLKKVVDGSDRGGISPVVQAYPLSLPVHVQADSHDTQLNMFAQWEGVDSDTQRNVSRSKGRTKKRPGTTVGWTGGGGFCYCVVDKPLVGLDPIIGLPRLNYTNGLLVIAVCLYEGFKLYGLGVRHGIKGRHFAHVTDQYVTESYIDAIGRELEEDETLTVYCLKMVDELEAALPSRITIQHIPQELLKNMESEKFLTPIHVGNEGG